MNKPAVLLRKINNLLACSLPRSLPSRYFRQSALGIWIPDSQGIQMVESCLAVEWSINQTAFEQRTKFCPLFRQSPFKFWSTIQITIQTVDVLNSRHLLVHYLNVSVIRMSSIRIPTVSEFLFLTRAEIHQVRLSKFSTCRFFIEKLPKKNQDSLVGAFRIPDPVCQTTLATDFPWVLGALVPFNRVPAKYNSMKR